MMLDLWRDIERALLRAPRHSRVFVGVVFALAMGIGFSGAVFVLVKGVLLTPLPAVDTRRLVVAAEPIKLNEVEALGRAASAIDTYTAYTALEFAFSSGSESRRVQTGLVTENFFEAVGVEVPIGRSLLDGPSEEFGNPVMLTDQFWRSEFGADPSIVGTSVRIEQTPAVVVGVAAPGFRGIQLGIPVDMFALVGSGPAILNISESDFQEQRSLQFIARYHDSRTLSQAQVEIALLSTSGTLGERDSPVRIGPIEASAVPFEQTGRFVLLLAAAAVTLLVIGVLNATNLLLADFSARRREFATLIALGASRIRVVRQLLLESAVMVVPSMALGALLATVLVRVWSSFQLPGRVEVLDVSGNFDWEMLAFGIGTAIVLVSLVTMALTGQVRAIESAIPSALRGRYLNNRSLPFIRASILTMQVALSLVLIIGFGLFVRTLNAAYGVQLGFDAARTIIAPVLLPPDRYSLDQANDFAAGLLSRVEAVPGVEGAGVGMTMFGAFTTRLAVRPITEGGERLERIPDVLIEYVTPRYLESMGIQLLAGRDITAEDTNPAQLVAVVNETLANRLAAVTPNVLGSEVGLYTAEEPITIVGIARNVRYVSYAEGDRMAIYLSRLQSSDPISILYSILTLRTSMRATTLVPAVRSEIAEFIQETDPAIAVPPVSTAREEVERALGPQVMASSLFAWFGLAGTALALIGTYGFVGYYLKQRESELAVRLALGARPSQLVRLVLSWVLTPACVGVAIGLWGALQSRSLVESWNRCGRRIDLPGRGTVGCSSGVRGCLWSGPQSGRSGSSHSAPNRLARLSHGFSSRRVEDAVRARPAPGGHRRRT